MGLGKKKMLSQGASAAPTPVGTDNFNTVLYTGNGSTQSITGVGFQPDFVWVKERSATGQHSLFDSVRGATKRLASNSTSAESTATSSLTSFDSDGFSFGAESGNNNGVTAVSWNWYAPTAESISASGSRVASTIKKNVDAGFSIVKTTSPSSTIDFNYGHGLSQAPELVMVKTLNIASYWEVIFPDTFGSASGSSSPSDWNRIKLNEPDAVMSSNAYLAADGTKIYNGAWQANTELINYCFHSVAGYQKVSKYTGTSGSVTVSDVGFQPRWIMIKRTEGAGDWEIVDSVRGDGGFNTAKFLEAGNAGAEFTQSGYGVTFTSTGFTIPSGAREGLNVNGEVFIYLA